MGTSQPVPERKAVAKAVRAAEDKLVSVRPATTRSAALVRRTQKAILDLDGAHEAYCAKLEKRAKSRATKLRRECDKRDATANEMVADARASAKHGRGDPTIAAILQANAEAFVDTTRNVNEKARQTDKARKRVDDQIRRLGDRFVVGALAAASSKDGGRAFLNGLSNGTDVVITAIAVVIPPAAATYLAIAGVVKMVGTFLVRKVAKGPNAAHDARYETALVSLRAATRLMRTWTSAIRST